MRKLAFWIVLWILNGALASASDSQSPREPGHWPIGLEPGTAQDGAVLDAFFALSRLPRPSGGEDLVRNYFVELAERSNARVGNPLITYESDAAGNILFTRQGTGRYARLTQPLAVIQAHMDMVWAVADAQPGEDLRPYFAKGVDVVFTDGWLHTRDFKTSLGADNGIGLSMLAALMSADADELPPLELLLTSREEQGLIGAKNIELLPKAPVMINIDTTYRDAFVLGCLGSRRILAQARYHEEPVSGGDTLELILTGLKGGHSGHDIGKPRFNAIRTITDIAFSLNFAVPGGIRIAGARAGSPSVLNTIPSTAKLTLVVDRGQAAQAENIVQQIFSAMLATASDEARDAKLMVFVNQDPASAALSRVDTQILLKAFQALRNGPISYTSEGATINTSSNLGYFSLAPGSSNTGLLLETGFMIRSYDADELAKYAEFNSSVLAHLTADPAASHVEPILPHSPTWLADTTRPFYSQVFARLPHYERRLTAGGIEPAVFSQKWPDKDFLAMGAEIKDAHSPRESLNVESIYTSRAALEALIGMLAEKAIIPE